ncbi:O-antigen ligase family protein [Algoriphagus marincola]|uniref:O-antigen ligase family protein n=1 Tax=Algoriphagus marincola TaxID=264027 RepID=A0ABS7N4P5_9BACT|nr:O-antigen ligase family protein [Algoriphagus marincola]MBY5950888.1 O-antigen ligase family protein [Algoriphagus marincola]
MIKYLIQNKYPIVLIIIHILLGFSATLTPYAIIAWFYLVLITSAIQVLKEKDSIFVLVSLIFYLISFELISRMARTSPFIPYELGKYLLCAGLVFGLLRYKTIGIMGWIMLLSLIPGFFIDVSGQVQQSDIIFNILGPINVALAIAFFNRKRLTSIQLGKILRLMIYPILGVLAYTFVKTPDFDEVEFVLGANVDLSGGFGSNQVSTLFGLGTLFIFILMVNKWEFSGYFILDALVLFALAFQGLLTFSRGGMLGAVLGIVVILFFLRSAPLFKRKKYQLPKIGKYVLPGILVAVLAYVAVDQITNGLLSLRYQGETMGTIQGSKEKSLYTITTGRLDIFLGDLNLWFENFIFGVGAGASRFLRETMTGTVAHVEVSRLLAEHGLFGLIYFSVLCIAGLVLLKYNENPMIKGILFALYLVAVYTSFHAAMRTFVTPALIGLSLLMIRAPKKVDSKKVKKKRKVPQLILE